MEWDGLVCFGDDEGRKRERFLPLPSIETGAAKTTTGVMARKMAERRRIGECIVVCVAELFEVVDWVVGG